MTFNQELITKARKGEIAILNDGSKEEMYLVASQVWPDDHCNNLIKDDNKHWKVYYKNPSIGGWGRDNETSLPAHSVKDFFMDQPESKESFKKYLESTTDQELKSRTYRVTRQQMKEIWELCDNQPYKEFLHKFAENRFWVFDDEIKLSIGEVGELLSAFSNFPAPYPEKLRSIFPEYFYIPEGEPVLVRNRNDEGEPFEWYIRVSDGKGGSYIEGKTSGISTKWHETIAYTKNPPK